MNSQLFEAVCNDNLLNAQELVLNGADANCRNKYGDIPLHYAKSLEIAQLLVLNGADVNLCDNNGDTPLHCVKSLEIARFLVLNGADVNSRNNNGNTPLYCVETLKIAHFLVLNGVDVNCRNSDGNTPLHCAIKKVNYLDDVNTPLRNYHTSFFLAYNFVLKYMIMLLEYGADMHIKNNKGLSAYDRAIQSNNNELIELFEQYNTISNGLDIKEPCSD